MYTYFNVCVLISNVNPISVQSAEVMGRHTIITVTCIVMPVSLDSKFRWPMMDIVKASVYVQYSFIVYSV